MAKILVIEPEREERMEKAPRAIREYFPQSTECAVARDFREAEKILLLHDDIEGIICALNFVEFVIHDVVDLGLDCKTEKVPFVVYISEKNDKPTEFQLGVLKKHGICFYLEKTEKTWGVAIQFLMDLIQEKK